MDELKLKRKIKNQKILIFCLIAIMVVSVVVGTTLAWYTKHIETKVGILFSNPVNIEVTGTGGQVKTPIITTNGKIMPASKVSVETGCKLISGPAYIRARLSVTCPQIIEDDGHALESLIEGENIVPNDIWEKVEFKNKNGEPDVWYVLVEKEAPNAGLAKVVEHGDTTNFAFYSGIIKIKEDLDNRYAKAQIRILFEVEAVQVENLPNPLEDKNNPTWPQINSYN